MFSLTSFLMEHNTLAAETNADAYSFLSKLSAKVFSSKCAYSMVSAVFH